MNKDKDAEIAELHARLLKLAHIEAEVGYLRQVENAAGKLLDLAADVQKAKAEIDANLGKGDPPEAVTLTVSWATAQQLERIAELAPVLSRIRKRAE